MMKPDIVNYAPTSQGNPVSGDEKKKLALPIFKGKYKEAKVQLFNVCGTLAVDVFSVTMRDITDLIVCTYKDGSDVKRCMDGMK